MPHKISGLDNRPVQVGTDRAVQRKGVEPAADAAGRSPAGGVEAVHITGSAKQLAALEQTLKELPVVDEARVASLRAAIESGTYKVDAARVAEKLLVLEEQLAGVVPQE